MNRYAADAEAIVAVDFVDDSGAPADPTAVALVVTEPDGTVVAYSTGDLGNPVVGTWHKSVAVGNRLGMWSYAFTGTGAVEATSAGSFLVGLADSYATAHQLKQAAGITDTVDDDPIELALSAASRMVDAYCRRRFWLDPVVVARFFEYDPWDALAYVDDIGSLAGMAVDVDQVGDEGYADAWTIGTHYALRPRNAPADGVPWTTLVRARNGAKSFPRGEGRIRVTARYGWPSVPDDIVQATLTQAARLWRRKDSPYGVAGSAELGSEMRLLASLDPDVQTLVRPFRRPASTGVAVRSG